MARAETFEELQALAEAESLGVGRQARVVSFAAPHRVNLGDPVEITWQTEQSRRVLLRILQPDPVLREVAHSGRFTIRAQEPGPLRVELHCWGQGDDIALPALRSEVREILVKVPPARLWLAHSELYAPAGKTVRLSWRAEGSSGVLLRRPLRGEEMEAPPFGTVDLLVDPTEDFVEMHAIGHDGSWSSPSTCAIRPIQPDVPDVRVELDYLCQPLEELKIWNR